MTLVPMSLNVIFVGGPRNTPALYVLIIREKKKPDMQEVQLL